MNQPVLQHTLTTTLCLMLLALMFPATLLAQVPQRLAYQSVVTDIEGHVVPDGAYAITFRLYDQPTGGEALFSEKQDLAVYNGITTTFIGMVERLNLPFDKPYFLSVEVDGQPESERQALSSVPYSLTAASVADGAAVRSLSGLQDEVELIAGDGISIETKDNQLVISAKPGVRWSGTRQERRGAPADYVHPKYTDTPEGPGYVIQGPGVGSDTGLDAAYDDGRTITANTGAVTVVGTGGTSFLLRDSDFLLDDTNGGIAVARIGVSGGAVTQEWRLQMGGSNGRLVFRDATAGRSAISIFPGAPNNMLRMTSTTFVVGAPIFAQGLIESSSGGFKFPDGTTQTTAATGGSGAGAVMLAGEPFMAANAEQCAIGSGSFTCSTDEARATMVAPRDGTLKNLYVRPNVAPTGGATVVVTVRKNGSDTALTLTYDTTADGFTTKSNTSDTVAITAGDTITVKYEETSGSNAGANFRATFVYE